MVINHWDNESWVHPIRGIDMKKNVLALHSLSRLVTLGVQESPTVPGWHFLLAYSLQSEEGSI